MDTASHSLLGFLKFGYVATAMILILQVLAHLQPQSFAARKCEPFCSDYFQTRNHLCG